MEIVSTMGSGSLGREIDLNRLVTELENHLGRTVDPNFSSDSMVTIRLEENGSAYTLFRTGTFQIRGAEDEQSLSEAEARLREILTKVDFAVSNCEFSHVTSVFMEDIEQEVNLAALSISLGLEITEYEPEQFPGLIYRPPENEVTLLVFASGKIIIGGTTDRSEARSAVQHLRDEHSILERT